MFEFIKERKAQAILDLVAQRLPRTLSSSSGVERCAAKGVANAYLLAGVGDYGHDFAHAPMKRARPRFLCMEVGDAGAGACHRHRGLLDTR